MAIKFKRLINRVARPVANIRALGNIVKQVAGKAPAATMFGSMLPGKALPAAAAAAGAMPEMAAAKGVQAKDQVQADLQKAADMQVAAGSMPAQRQMPGMMAAESSLSPEEIKRRKLLAMSAAAAPKTVLG